MFNFLKRNRSAVQGPCLIAQSPLHLISSAFGDNGSQQILAEYFDLFDNDQFDESSPTSLAVLYTIRFVQDLSHRAPAHSREFHTDAFNQRLIISLLQHRVNNSEQFSADSKRFLFKMIDDAVKLLAEGSKGYDHFISLCVRRDNK